MEIAEIEKLILQELPDSEINIQGEEGNYTVEVITPLFEELSKLKRQKKILSCVKQQISSGEIHAFSVQAFTPEEWRQASKLVVL